MDFVLSWIPCVKLFVSQFRPTQNFIMPLMELSRFTEVYLCHQRSSLSTNISTQQVQHKTIFIPPCLSTDQFKKTSASVD